MSRLFGALITLGVALLISACSQQWREATPSRTPEEVATMIDEISNLQGASLGGGDVAAALQNRSGAVVYFADAPSDLGGVRSLLSFDDFSFMGSNAFGYSWNTIANARVFAFVRPSATGAGYDVGLVIGVDQSGSGNFAYHGFNGQGGGAQDNEFVITMNGGAGSFELQSYDVVGGELADVIQFKVFQNGEFLGQFSTLVAYTQ